MFNRNKELLKTLEYIHGNNNYTDEQFIKAMYMAVKRTRQFNKYFQKWKKVPVAQRNTKDLCQTYFCDWYAKFDLQQDSLQDFGVANAVI